MARSRVASHLGPGQVMNLGSLPSLIVCIDGSIAGETDKSAVRYPAREDCRCARTRQADEQ